MKIFLKISLIIPVLYLFIIPAFFTASSGAQLCGDISIDLRDSTDYHFVTKRNLKALVIDSKVLGKPARDVPVTQIEERIRDIKELKNAEVYIGIDGSVHIYADQRDPVMRIVPDEGGDFFLDEEGIIFRKRNLYNPRLHIVGGNITISQAMLNGTSIFDTSIKRTVLKDCYKLVKYITEDDFWSAQIDQIYIDRDNEIDLLPRAGNHLIHLGTIENLEGKLRNLEEFYNKVLPEAGWDKYSLINLEYRDQIVCKRR